MVLFTVTLSDLNYPKPPHPFPCWTLFLLLLLLLFMVILLYNILYFQAAKVRRRRMCLVSG